MEGQKQNLKPTENTMISHTIVLLSLVIMPALSLEHDTKSIQGEILNLVPIEDYEIVIFLLTLIIKKCRIVSLCRSVVV